MSNKIADKIKKLLAHADSTSHPEEAESFMAKAQELLQAHGLSMLDLGTMGEDAVGESCTFGHNKANDQWRGDVAHALAMYYGCQVLFSQQRQKDNFKWRVFGRESARVTFELMWPYIDRQVLMLARREHGNGMYSSIPAARRAIGNALARRIWALRKENEKQEVASGRSQTGVNALVPVDIIRAALEAAASDLKDSKPSKLRTDDHARGVAGEINLNSQVRGNQLKIGAK